MVRKFIFDTDWFTDCDDCVALRFLARNLDGEHRLLGVNVNVDTPYSYASVCAFLKNEGVVCPVAVDKNGIYDGETRYQKNMAAAAPNFNDSSLSAPTSLDFYKKLLEENDEVEILSVGFLNSLAAVLKAYPKLVEKIKTVWCMGGDWSKQGGREYNFSCDGNERAIAASRFIVNEVACKQVFLGVEVGASVLTGGDLPKDDMLGRAMFDWGAEHGRSSWDPMLVMAAFDDKFKGAFELVTGRATVDENGCNYFEKQNTGEQAYVVKRLPDSYYEETINGYLKERM